MACDRAESKPKVKKTASLTNFSAALHHFCQCSKSIGVTPAFSIYLGVAEIAGGLGIALGVLTQLAAIGLILMNLVIACTVGGKYVLW
ncbi:MAG: hypothetical protein JWR19_1122 [Pedosphaera sp.]|nr:hypothetical protein [Pedosphaera sp.]